MNKQMKLAVVSSLALVSSMTLAAVVDPVVAQNAVDTAQQATGNAGAVAPAVDPTTVSRVDIQRPDVARDGRPEIDHEGRPEMDHDARPEVERPEVERAEVERPEVERAEVERPDVTVAHVERPEVEKPDLDE